MSVSDSSQPHEGAERGRLEETFQRLARAQHAPEAFHATVMARAARLPAPRTPWRYRLFERETQRAFRLPRAPALACIGVLLCCLAGLVYVYQHVTHLQMAMQQERQLRQQRETELAQLRKELATRQQGTEGTQRQVARADQKDVSRATLDVHETTSDETTEAAWHASLVAKVGQIIADIFEAVSRFVAEVWQSLFSTAPERDVQTGMGEVVRRGLV